METDSLAPNPYMFQPAVIMEKQHVSQDIVTFRLQLTDVHTRKQFQFRAGQFNMLYVWGVGEVAISIASDPDEPEILDHTVRLVGRTTRAMGRMNPGETLGLRGPLGRGWPVNEAQGHDIVIVTGGLGCAPVVGAIEYMFRRRESYGAITIVHGVKVPNDLLYRERFDVWRQQPNTTVLLSSDEPGKTWHYHVGVVTELFDRLTVEPDRTMVLMCGPEIMMRVAVHRLAGMGIRADQIHVSLERHMECGIGLCGHCQFGPYFLCKDGPVMRYDAIASFLGKTGL